MQTLHYENIRCLRTPNGTSVCRYSQSTKSKNSHEGDFLPFWELQGIEDRHWQDQDNQIRQNVHCCIGEPQPLFVQAITGNRIVPEL